MLGPFHSSLPFQHFKCVKLKIAVFLLTCRRRDRVGRSEILSFSFIFSLLKMGEKDKKKKKMR